MSDERNAPATGSGASSAASMAGPPAPRPPGSRPGGRSSACVADALGGALANSDDLLRRLSEWDAMNVAPYAGDRDYWLGEIDNARTLNRIALQQAKEAV